MIRPVRTPVDRVQEHLQALHIGSEVTRWFRKDREPNVIDVTPENVIAALSKAGINCVLMGTHGINGYRSQPRATQDVDVLVTKKEVPKALRALEQAFPYLDVYDSQVVTRFVDPVSQKVVLDLMKPASRAMQAVFRHTVRIGKTHRIPDLEMAVVSKFLALIAPNRRSDKKLVDAGDFTNIVLHHRPEIDLIKLRRLAENVHRQYGTRIMGFIADIDAGRTIQL